MYNATALRGPRYSGPMSPVQAAAEAVVRNTVPYWSRGRIEMALDEATETYSAPVQTLRLFGYGIGDQMTPALSPGVAAPAATKADTNLEKKSSTNNGEQFRIFGVGFFLNQGTTDMELAAKVLQECSVTLYFGASQGLLIGKPLHLPGGGGLQGSGRQSVTALNNSISFASNGWAEYRNVAIFPEGIRWNPEGKVDGQLIVNVTLERAVSVVGVEASIAPGIIDFDIRLFGEGQRPRSSNI